jgi:hypothetical protein
VRPETLIRWHRFGFRACWRALIREMSRANPLWGAPRIHGELLKLGFEIAQSTVAKYMARRRGPPSQGWKTFLRNHVPHVGAIDLFVVPTVGRPASSRHRRCARSCRRSDQCRSLRASP